MQTFQNVEEDLEKIPKTSGLYYFYDKDDKIMYVGLSNNLQRRMNQHYTMNSLNRQYGFHYSSLYSDLLPPEAKKVIRKWIKNMDWWSISWQHVQKIDEKFHTVEKIEIEEMPHELIKSKEAEMIKKLKPPFNHETASKEYYKLFEELE